MNENYMTNQELSGAIEHLSDIRTEADAIVAYARIKSIMAEVESLLYKLRNAGYQCDRVQVGFERNTDREMYEDGTFDGPIFWYVTRIGELHGSELGSGEVGI